MNAFVNLDFILSKLALKFKQLVLIDTNFPSPLLPNFVSLYPHRYLFMPCHDAIVLETAAGIASLGNLPLVIGANVDIVDIADPTLNIKILQHDKSCDLASFEKALYCFGAGVVLLPKEE